MKIFITLKQLVTLTVVFNIVGSNQTSLINGYSSICRWSVNTLAPLLYTADCITLTATQEPYLNVVKLGFCTEREFNNLTATVCGNSSSVKSDSATKLNFYNALDSLSFGCDRIFKQFVFNSVRIIVFKQQEMFCELSAEFIDYVRSYYYSDCNYYESTSLQKLKTDACTGVKTDVDQNFSIAILTTSSTCQDRIANCGRSNAQAMRLIKVMQYCEYFNIDNNGISIISCLSFGNACTLSDLIFLQDTACGTMTSVISSYSSACRLTMRSIAPNLHTSDCNAVSTSQENYLTLVKFGFCTEREFQNLTATACGSTSSAKSDSAAKLNFYNDVNQVSTHCQNQSLICFNKSINAIVLKQQEQYCSLLNLKLNGDLTENCLRSVCTYEEFIRLQSAACGVTKTDVDQRFSRAVLSTWSTCQVRISRCGVISPQTKQFVMKMQYCEAMSVLEFGNTTETCLELSNECNAAEFARLKDAACGTTAEALTSTNVISSCEESSVIAQCSLIVWVCGVAGTFILSL